MDLNPTKWLVIGTVILMLFFGGTPDLMDAIISRIECSSVKIEKVKQFDETPDMNKF